MPRRFSALSGLDPARSVPSCRSTLNCAGVRIARHLSVVFTISKVSGEAAAACREQPPSAKPPIAAEALAPGSSAATALLRENAGTLFAPPSNRPAETTAGTAADPDAADADAAEADAAAPPAGVASASAGQASFGALRAALAEDAGDGERSAAIDAIVRTAGVGRAEAERRFQALEQRAGEARAEAEAGRRAAASSLARAALAAFVAMLLGMVVGGLGGMLGRPGRLPIERPSRH